MRVSIYHFSILFFEVVVVRGKNFDGKREVSKFVSTKVCEPTVSRTVYVILPYLVHFEPVQNVFVNSAS